MAYVIGQACIGTKDTACVDVCPTDSIHGYEESNQLFIDPATCIDCDACAQACPVSAIFPGDQVPSDQQKFVSLNVDFFKSWERQKSIAVTKKKSADAATADSAAAASGSEGLEHDAEWKETEHWEEAWTQHQRDAEDPVEVQKRYGRVRALFETPEKYIIRFYLAEKTPNHPFLYRYSLPKTISGYELKANASGRIVKISGRLKNAKLAKLCGLVNSFPDRFYVELPMDTNVENVSVENKTDHIVDVVVTKKAA